MTRILRKLLIPAIAFGLGIAAQSMILRDRCLDAGGTFVSGVCHGAAVQ